MPQQRLAPMHIHETRCQQTSFKLWAALQLPLAILRPASAQQIEYRSDKLSSTESRRLRRSHAFDDRDLRVLPRSPGGGLPSPLRTDGRKGLRPAAV